MSTKTQQQKAAELKELNETTGAIYVLPNAWDAGSAKLSVNAGAQVVATTSAGVSWAKGLPDGQALTREQNAEVIREIVAVVDVPVSADIEGGYGPKPDDVAATVQAVIEAGAVGINLEDSGAPTGGLFSIEEQSERIKAGWEMAASLQLPDFQINARTDVYLAAVGQPSGRYSETLKRAVAYAEAGAATIFVPGLTDIVTITKLTEESPIPVNIMVGPGAPAVHQLLEAGVRRVSLGASVALAAFSVVVRGAREAIEKGTYDSLADAEAWDVIDGGFER